MFIFKHILAAISFTGWAASSAAAETTMFNGLGLGESYDFIVNNFRPSRVTTTEELSNQMTPTDEIDFAMKFLVQLSPGSVEWAILPANNDNQCAIVGFDKSRNSNFVVLRYCWFNSELLSSLEFAKIFVQKYGSSTFDFTMCGKFQNVPCWTGRATYNELVQIFRDTNFVLVYPPPEDSGNFQ